MANATTVDIKASRPWRRFSSAQRTARFAVYLVIVAAIVAALQTIEIIPEFLADAPEQIGDLLTRMWPIDWRAYPADVHSALIETIHIASLGTLLALVLALPVGVLAAHNLVPFTPFNWLAKLLLVSSRSVNSLVWALLFVGIFGPGAIAGTLAIAFRSIGFVGKLFGEALRRRSRVRSKRSPQPARRGDRCSCSAIGHKSSRRSGRSLCFASISISANPRCWDWWALAASAWRSTRRSTCFSGDALR